MGQRGGGAESGGQPWTHPRAKQPLVQKAISGKARQAILAKIEVNGSGADPLYKYLKKEQPGMLGSAIKWNFTKFLIDKDGKVVGRFAPTDKPESMKPAIEKLV